MNRYKLHFKQGKVVHEGKVSKIGQFGTLTCSPVSPDSGTTMPEKIKELHTFVVKMRLISTKRSSQVVVFLKNGGGESSIGEADRLSFDCGVSLVTL